MEPRKMSVRVVAQNPALTMVHSLSRCLNLTLSEMGVTSWVAIVHSLTIPVASPMLWTAE